MPLNTAELQHLAAGLARFGLFFHLDCEPPVRLWLGVSAIEPGINAVDLTGATYRGVGELIDLPSFSHLFDGTAERVEFSLSGISPTVLAQIAPGIMQQQDAIQGKEVHCGWAAMNYDWQLLGPIHWEWYGFADLIRLKHGGAADAYAPATAMLSLSCGDWMTGRKRAGLSFMTNFDQQRRARTLNPTAGPDQFAERVGLYHAGVEKPWPPA